VVVIAVAAGLLSRGVAWFNFGVFHSLVQPWIPVTLGLLEVVLNVVLAWLLVKPFGVVGIALATSIAHTVTMIVTLVMLTHRLGAKIIEPMLEPCVKIGVMTAALVVTAKLAAYLGVAALQPQGRFWESTWMLAGALPAGVAFLAVGALLRLAEVKGMLAVLHEKWIVRVGRLSGG
jgi:putative peptidoglycan lipid II flippase